MYQNTNREIWKSKNTEKLPDFIIGGAMKCGTTTLKNILQNHPKVYIPKNELNFFDFDNLLQHNDYISFNKKTKEWRFLNMRKDFEKAWQWYESHFFGKENICKGEDSTTYLASKNAAKRIALQDKTIKLIFIIRNPIERAFSNYLHLLNSGRAIYSFEKTIEKNPQSVLSRSLYYDQLKTYYNIFSSENIKIILFEDLIGKTQTTMQDLSIFLHLDFSLFPEKAFQLHLNKTKYPRNVALQLLKNKIINNFSSIPTKAELPQIKSKTQNSHQIFNRIYHKINPLQVQKSLTINPSTKSFLLQYFATELEGLDELIGKKVLDKWLQE